MKFIQDLLINKKMAINKKKCLKRGLYVLLPNLHTYVCINKYFKVKKEFPRGNKGLKQVIRRIIGLFFSFYVSTSGDFNGEIVYFSTISTPSYRDFKIFSPSQKKLLISFANQVRADLYANNRKRSEKYFPLPIIYMFDKENLFAIEEYISCNKEINISLEAIDSLFSFYYGYYEKCIQEGMYINTLEDDSKLLEKINAEECPILYMHHADLSVDNFIYLAEAKRVFIFFDFDHEDYYPPFYDIFFFLFDFFFIK